MSVSSISENGCRYSKKAMYAIELKLEAEKSSNEKASKYFPVSHYRVCFVWTDYGKTV